MNYGRVVVEQVLDALGIEIIAEHDGWGQARCPMHNDRRPSFTINMHEGGWRCYAGCGSSGDLARLVVQLTGEALEVVQRRMRQSIPNSVESLMATLGAGEAEPQPEHPPALFYQRGVAPRYMLRRGFTLETMRKWDVGWDQENKAVVLPVFDDGKLIGLIQRRLNREPKYYYEGFRKNCVLFGMEHIPADISEVTLVEGPLDAIWLDQCGYPAIASLGASLSDDQAEILYRRFHSVTIAYDADGAGRRGTASAIDKLSRLYITVLAIPPGKKDVQECTCDELAHAYATRMQPWEAMLLHGAIRLV
jgi:DNA primase